MRLLATALVLSALTAPAGAATWREATSDNFFDDNANQVADQSKDAPK